VQLEGSGVAVEAALTPRCASRLEPSTSFSQPCPLAHHGPDAVGAVVFCRAISSVWRNGQHPHGRQGRRFLWALRTQRADPRPNLGNQRRREHSQCRGQHSEECIAAADSRIAPQGFLTVETFGHACRLIGWVQNGKPVDASLKHKGECFLHAACSPGLTSRISWPASQVRRLPSSFCCCAAKQRYLSRRQGQVLAHVPGQCAHRWPSRGYCIIWFFNLDSVLNQIDPQETRRMNSSSDQSCPTRLSVRYGIVASRHSVNCISIDHDDLCRTLSDMHAKGSLDATEFVIAMYLIQAIMSNKLPKVPAVLPPGLLEAARVTPATAALQPQTTGLAPQLTGPGPYPIRPQTTGASVGHQRSTPISPNSTGVQLAAIPGWDITAQEKANSDIYFTRLDSQNKGLVEGDTAVPFFSESGLPQHVLAQVW
jgi:hypothetical protein